MQAILVMFRSDGERRSFSIAREMTVIGRREDCDLRIPLGDVSRKHCRLVRDGESLRLEDLGSSNGTYCNGQRVQEVTLNPGDSIQVGPVVFVLQIDGIPADEDLHPATPEVAEETDVAARENDLGPLSPTAQSEADGRFGSFPGQEGDTLEGLDSLDGMEDLGTLSGDPSELMLDDDSHPAGGSAAGELPIDLDFQQPHG